MQKVSELIARQGTTNENEKRQFQIIRTAAQAIFVHAKQKKQRKSEKTSNSSTRLTQSQVKSSEMQNENSFALAEFRAVPVPRFCARDRCEIEPFLILSFHSCPFHASSLQSLLFSFRCFLSTMISTSTLVRFACFHSVLSSIVIRADASRSYDADFDPLFFSWCVETTAGHVITQPANSSSSQFLFQVSSAGSYVLRVSVTGCALCTDSTLSGSPAPSTAISFSALTRSDCYRFAVFSNVSVDLFSLHPSGLSSSCSSTVLYVRFYDPTEPTVARSHALTRLFASLGEYITVSFFNTTVSLTQPVDISPVCPFLCCLWIPSF